MSLKQITLVDVFSPFLFLQQKQPDQCFNHKTDFQIKQQLLYSECHKFTPQTWGKNVTNSPSFKHIFLFMRKRRPDDRSKPYFKEDRHISWNKASELCHKVNTSLPLIRDKQDLHFLVALLLLPVQVRYTEGLFTGSQLEVGFPKKLVLSHCHCIWMIYWLFVCGYTYGCFSRKLCWWFLWSSRCVRGVINNDSQRDTTRQYEFSLRLHRQHWQLSHSSFLLFQRKMRKKTYYEFWIFLNDWNPRQMNKHDGSCQLKHFTQWPRAIRRWMLIFVRDLKYETNTSMFSFFCKNVFMLFKAQWMTRFPRNGNDNDSTRCGNHRVITQGFILALRQITEQIVVFHRITTCPEVRWTWSVATRATLKSLG